MIRLEPAQFSVLMPFVPDLPDATLPLFALTTGRGSAWVDDAARPLNMIVGMEGTGPGDLDKLYLYGSPGSPDLREFLGSLEDPTEVHCSEELAELVLDLYPDDASPRSGIVYYFDRIPEALPAVDAPEPQHLRSGDAAEVRRLLPAWAWRTFEGARDLVMTGTVFGLFEGETLVSAAFVHDVSMKFETIAAVTENEYRGRGLAARCCRWLMRDSLERHKLPRFATTDRHEAGVRLAESLEFPCRKEITSYFVDVF